MRRAYNALLLSATITWLADAQERSAPEPLPFDTVGATRIGPINQMSFANRVGGDTLIARALYYNEHERGGPAITAGSGVPRESAARVLRRENHAALTGLQRSTCFIRSAL